jgi:membrane associated rhomboid family serine protease
MAYGPEQRIELALPTPAKLLTPGVLTVLVLMIAGYTLLSYAEEFAIGVLALSPSGLMSWRVWQLLTYPFIASGWPTIWNGLCILFFGSAVEREWGTKSFFILWLVVTIACGLIWVGISLLFRREFIGVTADAPTYGILGAFGLLFWRKRFLFFFWGMEAQYIAAMLIIIGLLWGIPTPIVWVWVAGAGVAYLYIKLIWKARTFSFRSAPKDAGRFKDL